MMAELRLVATALIVATLVACGGSSPVPDTEVAEPVAFDYLFNEFASRTFLESTYVFQTQAVLDSEWAKGQAWTGLGSDPTKANTAPLIDFVNFSVIGVSLGVGTRCFIPEILSVNRIGEKISVTYRTNRDRQITTTACNYNFPLNTFIKIPVTSGAVVFNYQRE